MSIGTPAARLRTVMTAGASGVLAVAAAIALTGTAGAATGAYNITTRKFARVTVPGAAGLGPSLTATAINNHGDVAGFYNPSPGVTDGFLKLANGDFFKFAVTGAAMTQAFGVNDSDNVVGTVTYSDGATHGFTWKPGTGFKNISIDAPAGNGTTVLNGINNENDLVGFYTDGQGNVDGLVAFPPFSA